MTRRELSLEEGKTLCLPPKPEVLIVVGPKGVIEVYTSRWMRVCIATKSCGLPDTAEAELASEAYLEMSLPTWALELYWPGYLQVQDTIRLLRPSEDMERRTNLAVLEVIRECRKIVEERKP